MPCDNIGALSSDVERYDKPASIRPIQAKVVTPLLLIAAPRVSLLMKSYKHIAILADSYTVTVSEARYTSAVLHFSLCCCTGMPPSIRYRLTNVAHQLSKQRSSLLRVHLHSMIEIPHCSERRFGLSSLQRYEVPFNSVWRYASCSLQTSGMNDFHGLLKNPLGGLLW